MPDYSVLSNILGLENTRIIAHEFTAAGVTFDVRPDARTGHCSGCMRGVRRVHDTQLRRTWRDLDLGGMAVTLRYDVRRLDCPRCGVRVELVPWAEHGLMFTTRFETHTAYLAQQASRTIVADLMRVAWRTVGNIIGRVVDRLGTRGLLDNLRRIGVDELSYRKHHQYITVVVDHDTGKVVWASPGKNAATLKRFFTALGPERCKLLENVSIDMSAAYISAVTEGAPNAQIVFDRFHVQRLVHDALDELRRAEVREARAASDAAAAADLKHSRWALQKNPWNLDGVEREKLSTLQLVNKRLYRGYLLKEALAAVLGRRQANVARTKLIEWCSWATHSGLPSFGKAARTIRKHIDGVVAYVQAGISNGRVEGLNGKARTITRRAYGFHNPYALISMLFLCCSGIQLAPVRVFPSKDLLPL